MGSKYLAAFQTFSLQLGKLDKTISTIHRTEKELNKLTDKKDKKKDWLKGCRWAKCPNSLSLWDVCIWAGDVEEFQGSGSSERWTVNRRAAVIPDALLWDWGNDGVAVQQPELQGKRDHGTRNQSSTTFRFNDNKA